MVVVEDIPHCNGIILISGPSRGGKSRWAEHLLSGYESVSYIATSAKREQDPDWEYRLQLHRDRRPEHWTVFEASTDIVDVINNIPSSEAILIDSLGGLVAYNLDQSSNQWDLLVDDLIQTLRQHVRTILIVIEETGWGVVPNTASGCLFRDRLGKMAQDLEAYSNDSWLVIQGRAINLKHISISVP